MYYAGPRYNDTRLYNDLSDCSSNTCPLESLGSNPLWIPYSVMRGSASTSDCSSNPNSPESLRNNPLWSPYSAMQGSASTSNCNSQPHPPEFRRSNPLWALYIAMQGSASTSDCSSQPYPLNPTGAIHCGPPTVRCGEWPARQIAILTPKFLNPLETIHCWALQCDARLNQHVRLEF